MKILYITNQPSPYQLQFQEEFNNIENASIEFLFYHDIKNRPKNWRTNHYKSRNKFSNEFLKLIPEISSYDAVLSLGTARRFSLIIMVLKFFKLIRCNVYIVTETMRNEKQGSFRNSFVLKYLLRLYSLSNCQFLATNYHAQFQLELLGVKSSRIQVFNYPIGIYHIPRLRLDLDVKEEIRILYCSRMIRQYDPIKAVKQYMLCKLMNPNTSFTMVKYGPLYKEVQDFVKNENLDVQFVNPVDFESLPKFYSDYDFLLLPARFGNGNAVVMEAGMCGVIPIVKDSTPGAREQITDGLTGFSYKTDDEFKECLRLALNLNVAERVALQKNIITAFSKRMPYGRALRLHEIIRNNI